MIAIGTRLGSYQITSLLGQGGMGEVYRATDSKLNRDVALKVLPSQFVSDADRMERFQREAHVLASLNHSNIAAIYGIEDSEAMRALVMELVEGPTLANRIAQGPIPADEVLSLAKQIAEALEYAHERGVIHRDLKPANIKLTTEGKVKVLDFGLAKAINSEAQSAVMSNSPTLSLAATQAGVILGTAAYMSPEQAKGKPVDRRADIWAFGVVVYEMLTGSMMFGGETVSETMAEVMMKEPNWNALPAATPTRLRDLLRRCLAKDPRNRIRDIGDVRIAIEEAIALPEPQTSTAPSTVQQPHRPSPHFLRWISVAALAIALAIVALAPWRRTPPAPAVMRLTSELGADVSLSLGAGAAAFPSPDGTVLAFLATRAAGQKSQIYVRRLDQLQAAPLDGTDGARNAFFSPDGAWIGFFADGKLRKISVNGGATVTLCDAADDRGGAWGDDGFIVFAPNTRSGLWRVSSAGGMPEELTKLDQASAEITQRWPQVLPGSQAVLFLSSSTANNYEDANIVVQSVRTGERKIVHRGGFYPRFVSSGHLLYLHQGTLFAVPFDMGRLEVTGQPVPVLESVTSSAANGSSQFAFSQAGPGVYLEGGYTTGGTAISWMDSTGKTQPLRSVIATYLNPMFSPDGRKLAFEMVAQQNDVWVYEMERDTMSRLTLDPTRDVHPVWTPDGRRIAFGSQRGDKSTFNLYWQNADGTGEPQRLTESKNPQVPNSWHPTGKFLAFTENSARTNNDIMILPMEGDVASGWKAGKPTTFLSAFFQEYDPAFSPDGRWIAYRSNESGSYEVQVRPFPGPGGKFQISTGGGWLPTWSQNGKELFYRTPDSRIMVVTYKAEGDTFRADKPRLWSEGQFVDRATDRNFDLHPDGRRFAVLNTTAQTQTKFDKVNLVFNFFDELRRIAK